MFDLGRNAGFAAWFLTIGSCAPARAKRECRTAEILVELGKRLAIPTRPAPASSEPPRFFVILLLFLRLADSINGENYPENSAQKRALS
jgi:hypothetical protein